MDFGGLLGLLGDKIGFGGALDLATNDPSKLVGGGLLGLADKADIGFPAGLGIANNLGAGGVGMAALAGNKDIAKEAMTSATPATKAFDLKGLATDLNALAQSREESSTETESMLNQAMAKTMQAAGSGLTRPPQGALPASPPAPSAQIARAANPSPAAQAIMSGAPAGTGFGAQPSVQDMMRRLYGI